MVKTLASDMKGELHCLTMDHNDPLTNPGTFPGGIVVRLGVGDIFGHQCNYSFYLQTSRVSSRCFTPGTDKAGKCPAVARGRGGGLGTAAID